MSPLWCDCQPNSKKGEEIYDCESNSANYSSLKRISSHKHNPQALAGSELPLQVSVQGSDVNASGDVDTLCHVIDVLQGSLDTIKDGPHDSWTQLDR